MSFVLYYILITKVVNIPRQDYFRFVLNNASYIEDQEIFNDHFDFLSNKIENYEKLSYEQQFNLIKTLLDKKTNKGEYSQILNITNRNQDIIRIVRNIRQFHNDLIKSGIYKIKTLNILNSLCEAYRLILSDTGDDLLPNVKNNLESASELFQDILEEAVTLPSKLRNDIKLESLRYLTYCSLRLDEENSKIKEWLNTAKELENKSRQIYSEETSLRNHQNYFWISLVNVIIAIKEENSLPANVSTEYCKNLSCLSENDQNCVYLKAKLLQHLMLIPLEKREKIYHFVSGN